MLEIKVGVLSMCIFAVTSAWRLACLISLCQCFGFLVFLWFFAQEEISRHSCEEFTVCARKVRF